MDSLKKEVFNIKNASDFEQVSLKLFYYQAIHNPVYKKYLQELNIDHREIKSSIQIPFLPIEFFRTFKVITGDAPVQKIFLSSGTTGDVQSKHYITDISIYQQSFRGVFNLFYGPIEDYCILALLPSYEEQGSSSLVFMVNDLIKGTRQKGSGFYLQNKTELIKKLKELDSDSYRDKKVILLGLTYALLDLISENKIVLKNAIVIETGGMKGRGREMVREELHHCLSEGFGVDVIHSEYGMTELLSQAYSNGKGFFLTPPWMKILIRDANDPLSIIDLEKTGGINVIDLANINSCAFIATQDLGKTHADGSFEVLGRFDNSSIRGCNLMSYI